MMRRLFWFCLGALCGAYGILWTRKKAIAIGERLTPRAIAYALLDTVKFLIDKLIDLLKTDDAATVEAQNSPSLN